MNAAQLIEEFRQAQEEYERALATVKQMKLNLENAKSEYTNARVTEIQSESAVDRATEQLSAGLKALQIPDQLPTISDYIVEYHANIGCYQCYLQVDAAAYDGVESQELSIQVVFPTLRVIHTTTNQTEEEPCDTNVWWEIEIERNVDQDKCHIEVKSDHIYIRLPIRESDKEIVDSFTSFSHIDAEELMVDNYNNISCRGCAQALITESSFEKVLPLPSANWMEMFDFWGSGLGSFEHLPREGIYAHSKRIYVGETHILLYKDDVLPKTLTIKEETTMKDEDWIPLACSCCLTIIGAQHKEEISTYRLQKHLISACKQINTEDYGTNILERYSIDSTICTQLLHAAESEGVFRVHLISSDASSALFDGLKLQLLSWDAMILQPSKSAFLRVLKVLYETATKDQMTSVVPAPLRTHQMMIAPDVGAAILDRLKKSTSLLPDSQQEFNRMTVGYLYV